MCMGATPHQQAVVQTGWVESDALDRQCNELHVEQISDHITDWEKLAPYFGLTEWETQEILAGHAD